MRTLVAILTLGMGVALSISIEAAPSKKSAAKSARHASKHKKATSKASAGGDLKTEVSFDDSVLHGQYQTPDEALARVENEKGFGDLVGVRKHFKDRLEKAAEQE